jgi:DNA-directed RNA polymerase I subunit RPA2
MIIKERLEEALTQVRNQIALDVRKEDPTVNFVDSK